jgi:predicted GNAT family acetyltransferase
MNMYTVPAWRGRGIASSLLQHMLAANCRRVILHAAPRAVPIYLRAGFASSYSFGFSSFGERALCSFAI